MQRVQAYWRRASSQGNARKSFSLNRLMKFFLTRQVKDLENISRLDNEPIMHATSLIDQSLLLHPFTQPKEESLSTNVKNWQVIYGKPLSRRMAHNQQRPASSMNVSRISSYSSRSRTSTVFDVKDPVNHDLKEREASWKPVINKPTGSSLTLPLPQRKPQLTLPPIERKRPRMKPLLDCRR